VVIAILVLAGAGAALLYHFVGGLTGRAGHATRAVRGAPPPIAAAPAARAELSRPVRPSQAATAPVVDPAAAVELARTALRHDLAATSPRVQRLAAVALARTQDAEACELLAAQLGLGPAGAPVVRVGAEADELAGNDIARLDLAYALARGGDRRGIELLARALGAPRGEARDEAAGLLARLGDRRAVPHLLDLLAVEQRRLGAAEHLARLAEPRALQVLDHVRGDPRASADDKARATVALGTAGRGAVAGALRDMLGDPHFNAFAAAALAAQGDRAARPVLERQLASPPLRVQAARALRRLDPAIDPRPLLPPLLDVVRAGRDIDRIPAAEAILLLVGPAGWSAYD
jgi:HEAT repeat protein